MITRPQTTLRRPASLTGRGYWSGQDVCVTFHPAAVDSGIVFRRDDLPENPHAKVTAESVDGVSFRTNLVIGDQKVELIEHAMAALAGMQIDNAVVAVDAREMPGLDGSSADYVKTLRQAGTRTLSRMRKTYQIKQPIRIADGDAWITAQPSAQPSDQPSYRYELDYDDGPIERQSYECFKTVGHFVDHLSVARTFVTRQQAEALQASGVGRHVTPADLVIVDQSGPLQTDWRMANECAAHKTLDMIGDLAAVGVDLVGCFTSHRGGHRLNAQLSRRIAAEIARAATDQSCYITRAA